MVSVFSIIEGAGAFLYNIEPSKDIRKRCYEKCSLHTSSNTLSMNCMRCIPTLTNNIMEIDKKTCVKFCKLNLHLLKARSSGEEKLRQLLPQMFQAKMRGGKDA